MSERIIYDGADLVTTISDKVVELERALNDFMAGGVAVATAEREYKKIASEWTVKLRKKGTPAAIIDKTLLGIEEVANARYKRDVAAAIYEAQKERINCTKLEIRILEGQISREYGKYERG